MVLIYSYHNFKKYHFLHLIIYRLFILRWMHGNFLFPTRHFLSYIRYYGPHRLELSKISWIILNYFIRGRRKTPGLRLLQKRRNLTGKSSSLKRLEPRISRVWWNFLENSHGSFSFAPDHTQNQAWLRVLWPTWDFFGFDTTRLAGIHLTPRKTRTGSYFPAKNVIMTKKAWFSCYTHLSEFWQALQKKKQ